MNKTTRTPQEIMEYANAVGIGGEERKHIQSLSREKLEMTYEDLFVQHITTLAELQALKASIKTLIHTDVKI